MFALKETCVGSSQSSPTKCKKETRLSGLFFMSIKRNVENEKRTLNRIVSTFIIHLAHPTNVIETPKKLFVG